MKQQNVKIILVEPYFDTRTPKSIASQTGGEVLVLPPSIDTSKGITDYFKLFDYDVAMLVDAAKKG